MQIERMDSEQPPSVYWCDQVYKQAMIKFMTFEQFELHEVSQFSIFKIPNPFQVSYDSKPLVLKKDMFLFWLWSPTGRKGTWAEPCQVKAYQDRCLDYMDLCDPKLVHQEPPLFWGFWGQCFNDYRFWGWEGWASWARLRFWKTRVLQPEIK